MRILAVIVSLFLTFSLVYVHYCRLEGLRYQRLAGIAEKQGLPKQSLYFAYKGLEANPYNFSLYSYMGVSLMKTGDYVHAAKYLKIYLKYNPYDPNALNNMGLCKVINKMTIKIR